MKAVLVKINEQPKVVDLPAENTWESMKEHIGLCERDLLEVVPVVRTSNKDMLEIYVDEEGKLKEKPANRPLFYFGIFDVIAGDFIIVKRDIEDDEYIDMTQDEINQMTHIFKL